jgi:hypothetical protein
MNSYLVLNTLLASGGDIVVSAGMVAFKSLAPFPAAQIDNANSYTKIPYSAGSLQVSTYGFNPPVASTTYTLSIYLENSGTPITVSETAPGTIVSGTTNEAMVTSLVAKINALTSDIVATKSGTTTTAVVSLTTPAGVYRRFSLKANLGTTATTSVAKTPVGTRDWIGNNYGAAAFNDAVAGNTYDTHLFHINTQVTSGQGQLNQSAGYHYAIFVYTSATNYAAFNTALLTITGPASAAELVPLSAAV